MSDRRSDDKSSAGGRSNPGRPIALVLWNALMAAGGLGFGMLGDRRPFGEGALAHPLLVFFIAAGVALLLLRVAMQRPVPEIIPDRALMLGCALGLAAFLAGNFLGAHVLPLR